MLRALIAAVALAVVVALGGTHAAGATTGPAAHARSATVRFISKRHMRRVTRRKLATRCTGLEGTVGYDWQGRRQRLHCQGWLVDECRRGPFSWSGWCHGHFVLTYYGHDGPGQPITYVGCQQDHWVDDAGRYHHRRLRCSFTPLPPA